MQRIPEPELMNEPAQALAYAEADFSDPHNAFIDGFVTCFPDCSPQHVLDLGCGPGDITERFAQRFPGCHITATDGAQTMLELARQRAQRLGLSSRIDYILSYLPDASLAANADVIISNSLLHHMKNPLDLWQTICHHRQPGIIVYVMDLMRPPSIAVAKELLLQYAADEPEVLQHDFYHSLLAAYEPDEVQMQLKQAGLDGLKLEVISDRHLLVSGKLD